MGDFIRYNYVEIFVAMLVFAAIVATYLIIKSKRAKYIIAYSWNLLLYKFGFKKTISQKYITRIHVKECYEHLEELVNHHKIIIDKNTVESPVLLRKTVANKLYRIADNLADNEYIKIYRAYSSRLALTEKWNEEFNKMQSENSNIGKAQMLSILNKKYTNPDKSMGGHDTGAALDVALCDKNGNDLDFGSKYREKASKHSNEEQKKNRLHLVKIMKAQGFVNNPTQWWHFSYGDKTWALYKGKRYGAIYDSAEKQFENMGYVRIVKTDISSANIK